MKQIDTLLFDLDGTLVDSWPAMYKSIAYALEKMDRPVISFQELLSYAPKGMIHAWRSMLQSTDDTTLHQAVETYKTAFSELFFHEIVTYPGVVETLDHFRDKEKIVVTNAMADHAWEILGQAKLDHFMDDIIGGDDIGCLKPTACPLDREMDKFETDKHKVIMVGDMVVDIEAGKAAGVRTCAVTYGIGKLEDLKAAEPDYLIHAFRELKDLFSP
jgi:HAD superfamily hydrolase (TIGR01549 family)